MHYDISFPHLGITLDHVGKSVDLFGVSIAYYGIIIGMAILIGFAIATSEAKKNQAEPGRLSRYGNYRGNCGDCRSKNLLCDFFLGYV